MLRHLTQAIPTSGYILYVTEVQINKLYAILVSHISLRLFSSLRLGVRDLSSCRSTLSHHLTSSFI